MTKGRWRVFTKVPSGTVTIPDTIIAWCVLDNICVLRGDELDTADGDNDDSNHGDDDDDSAPPPSQVTAVVLQALVQNVANQ